MKRKVNNMKRLIIFMMVVLFLLMSSSTWAAGTITQTKSKVSSNVTLWTFTCTADSADGSFPATASSSDIEGYVILVVTNPGATAPTDNYDITLTDEDSVDVMGGELANRDTSNSEQAIPLVGNAYSPRWVQETLTLNISNNSVNSAIIVVKVYVSL